jgi:hypothetical protein
MRYLALIGFAICRFSFAQIATSANATQFHACLRVPDPINTSPLYFLDRAKANFAIDQTWLFTSTDITSSNLTGTYQTNFTKFSANIVNEGTSDFNQNGLSFSIAQKINKSLVLGTGIAFSSQTALENRLNQLGFNIYSSYQLNSSASLAFWYSQIGKSSIQNLAYNFQINSKIYSGIGVTLIGYEPIVSGSLVYAPNKSFYNTITMGTGSMPFSTAMSFFKNKWTYTFKLAYLGNNLGFQPSFRLNYLINEQKSSTEPVGIDFVRQTLPSN